MGAAIGSRSAIKYLIVESGTLLTIAEHTASHAAVTLYIARFCNVTFYNLFTCCIYFLLDGVGGPIALSEPKDGRRNLDRESKC